MFCEKESHVPNSMRRDTEKTDECENLIRYITQKQIEHSIQARRTRYLDALSKTKICSSYEVSCQKILKMGEINNKQECNGLRKSSMKNNFLSLTDQMKLRMSSNDPWFSLEFFPPKTTNGARDLFDIMECFAESQPLFCDMTWHLKNDPQNLEKPTSSLCMASTMLNYFNLPTMLHITSGSQSVSEIKNILIKAKDQGIRNILALRGDKFPGHVASTVDELPYAVDLVRLIRKEHGDHFVIVVAGYPSGHPECASYEEDLKHLKEKVDAGADFIITQLFFEMDTFEKYVKDCREIGITCPILPGILPIQSYLSLRHVSKLTQLSVPEEILNSITPIKDNDEAVRNFGVHHAVELGKKLLNSGLTKGMHFYTLNQRFATTAILKQLGLLNEEISKPLPWKPSVNYVRLEEEIRPIFWKGRRKSYICRTADWNKFPNGRWGNSSHASFGNLTDYYMFYLNYSSNEEQLKSLGFQLETEQDVWNVFYCFIKGHENQNGVKVTHIPWSDDALSPETSLIADQLAYLNKNGVLTINSQPAINGFSSTHPIFGWGNPGGYVYQKAYLEFFTSKENVEVLKKLLVNYPQVNYHIGNSQGDMDYTNCDETQPIAVTWGVFPGMEIIQPTVVDPIAFKIWKEEAFSLWKTNWRDLYDPNSKSHKLIDYFYENYQLVNLVDNNFVQTTCLWEITTKMLSGETN
ncbi:methylenetetrahydrofolate reductase-like [Octopus vulgaris]|uniref:methylenetetrahydrofolate reductase (NADPH) n=1 Tax=Octopus vulgaris TaxID=6645 RepID=A0AA36EZE0_OCTVU|nr:methylenetetrahydrofolate reductase-like [Octopus vulgaris]